MKRLSASMLVLLALPGLALAHGPSRQKVEKSVTIAAPAEKVWALVGDLCGLQKFLPDAVKCEGSGANAVGATRVLTFKDEAGGPKIHEEVTKFEPEKSSYKYKITENDVNFLPVTTYSAEMSVKAVDAGSSQVTWKAGFYRGYTNNDPPPELSDEAAVKAVTNLFDAGLAKLKELAEAP